jgi:pSer/pThr/pTyr-binding forkhead associated (FHA) protein
VEAERFLEPVGHDSAPFVLNRKVMTVSRTDDNDICIPSKMVSRHHARLLVGPNAVIVEDIGSTNGCYVNDHAIRKQLLREGDVLRIGDRNFKRRTRQQESAEA